MFSSISLKEINCGGLLMLPYIMIRELGVPATATLSQIISEYNYAIKNNFSVEGSYLTDEKRMADYLGITKYELKQILDLLQSYELISWYESEIEDTLQIFVWSKNIKQFKFKLDEKYNYIKWDTGLKQAQNPIHKANEFEESTLALKEHMERYYITDIPIVIYQRCNDFILDYESDGLCFADIENLYGYIKENIELSEYLPYSLVDIVYVLCKQKL